MALSETRRRNSSGWATLKRYFLGSATRQRTEKLVSTMFWSPESIRLVSAPVRRAESSDPMDSRCTRVETFSTVSTGQKWKCRPWVETSSFGSPNTSSWPSSSGCTV
jgi:hypothetical protein